MTVLEFNIEKGLYRFNLSEIETTLHHHPALEIVVAHAGSFSLTTSDRAYNDLTFAIIGSNQPHQLSAIDCDLELIIIEHHEKTMDSFLLEWGMEWQHGVISEPPEVGANALINALTERVKQAEPGAEYDPRVKQVIDHLRQHELSYDSMTETLSNLTQLSESRLSHLFKAHIGVSIKKYLLWCRLRNAIQQHLHQEEDLLTALYQSGFYDQPHFSRAFKEMMGVQPSKAYNSRTVQVSPKSSE